MSYTESHRSRHWIRAGREVMDLTHPFKEGLRSPSGDYTLDQPSTPLPPPEERDEPKNIALAIILAIIPGLGLVYLRQFVRGIAVAFIVMTMFLLYPLVVTAVVGVFVYAWQFYSTYRTGQDYNRSIMETGRRPW